MRALVLGIALAATTCLFAACAQDTGSTSGSSTETSAQSSTKQSEPASTSTATGSTQKQRETIGTEAQIEAVAGTWAPVGVLYGDEAKLFKDNPTLKDLYDSTYITFYDNGCFAYQKKIYIYRGTWWYYNESNGMPCYALKTDSVAKLTLQSGMGGEETDSSNSDVYLAYITGDQPFLVLHRQGDNFKETPLPVFVTTDAYEVPMEASSTGEERIEDAGTNAPTGFSADSSSSSSSSPSNSTGSTNSTSTSTGTTSDEYINTDQGVVRKGEDGSLTIYNETGITTSYPDGSMEWTDGFGTVTRDLDGDAKPDYISYDSGETWQVVTDY